MSSFRKLDELLRLRRALAELDARINVFGVLAKDHHVELLRMLHRAGHARVVLHRPHAGVQIENLPQRHIQRADTAPHRCRQRPFDRNPQIARRIDRLIRQPRLEFAKGLFSRVNLEPLHRALAAVRLLYRRVENPLRGAPDVAAGTVAFNKRDDGVVGNREFSIGILNRLAAVRQRQSVIARLHVVDVLR